MTIKHILLPLTGEAAGADVAACGVVLAKRLGAHITAGFEDEMGPIYFGPELSSVAFTYGVFYDQIKTHRSARKALARKHFDAAVAASKLPLVNAPVCNQSSAMWFSGRGDDESLTSLFAGLTDLIVLPRPGDQPASVAWMIVEKALFRVHRPTLIIPPQIKSVSFSRPLIAWNGSKESARAAEHAVDLFEPGAKATVLEIGELKRGRLPAHRVIDYLGWHGFEAELRCLADRPKETVQIILDELRRADATCLVMGAYTHSRTHEMLFGGVTDFMMRHALLPVLMAH